MGYFFKRRLKMKVSKVLLIIVIIFSLFLVSCAKKAIVPITRPAEINLVGIKRIAMGDITGNAGTALSDILTQKLFESGRYEVLDRQNINALMREHNLNLSGAVDEATAVKIGGLLGTSAMIFGSSNGQYSQKTEIGQRYSCGSKREPSVCQEYKKIGQGRISTTLKVVDLKTGKIVAIKNFSEQGSDSASENNEWPPDLDQDVIMGKILNTTAAQFMKMIAPYTDFVSVEFDDDSKMPEVNAGIESAQKGLWDSASIQFKNAVDRNPSDAAAWYNLGLAYMYTYRFDDAIQAFNRSNSIKPSSKCSQEIANCNSLRAEKKKLDAQMTDK
jgi:tetratricopeptide (TPR) repeat protein